jgi:hypothetical protein
MELYDMTTGECEYIARCSYCLKSTAKHPEAMCCEVCGVPFEREEKIVCGYPSEDAEERVHCHEICNQKPRPAQNEKQEEE